MANEMTVYKLKELCDKVIADGFGDAIVMVQANADHISDIIVNGFEGYGCEFGEGPKVFSLESNPVNENDPDEVAYKNRYGENVIQKEKASE
jgi:hypothetical protein